MSRRELLMNAQQSVAVGLLDEGITVVYDADTPWADLKAGVMHARPLPEVVSEDDLLHLRADVDHETGHFGATDSLVVEGITRPLVKVVHNAIEDGFIERWVSDKWLGSAQTIRRSNELVCAEIRAKATGQLADRRARAVNALQFLTFGEPLPEVLERCGPDIEPILAVIADLCLQLTGVSSTAEGLELAREIVDRWRWGNSRKKVSADQYEQEKEFKAAEDRVAKQVKKKAAVADQRKAKIGAMEHPPSGFYRVWDEQDVVEPIFVSPLDAAHVPNFLDSVRRIVPPLRRRLLMEFRARSARDSYGFKRGQLDQTSLHKVAIGRDDLFTQEIPAQAVEADVVLLVDVSGSMVQWVEADVTRVRVAAQAACAFSMVLDRIGVTNECLAFTTTADFEDMPDSVFLDFQAGRYERVRPLHHLIVKGARQRFRGAQASFAALAAMTDGAENIDGEALLWAAQRLLTRCGRKKPVIIVLSDGVPASTPESQRVLRDHLKLAVERVTGAGVSLIGVGIADNSVRDFYPNSVVIKKVTDLVGTSYTVLRDVLRGALRTA